jgi:hypothetical protein
MAMPERFVERRCKIGATKAAFVSGVFILEGLKSITIFGCMGAQAGLQRFTARTARGVAEPRNECSPANLINRQRRLPGVQSAILDFESSFLGCLAKNC